LSQRLNTNGEEKRTHTLLRHSYDGYESICIALQQFAQRSVKQWPLPRE
jgi:hypothetical protein